MLVLEKAREKMDEAGLDVLIAASLPNVYYSTGYYPHFTHIVKEHIRFVVIPKRPDLEPFIVSPDFEVEDFGKYSQFKQFVSFPTEVYIKFAPDFVDNPNARARKNVEALDLSPLSGLELPDSLLRLPSLVLAKALKDRGLERSVIGVDYEKYLTVKAYEEIKKALPYAHLKDACQVFIDLRSVKTPREIEIITQATVITEEAIRKAIDVIDEGVNLLEVFDTVAQAMTDAESGPFEMAIDVLGSPTTLPWDHVLQKGEIVRLDVGAKHKHYCADVCRNVAVGDPDKEMVRLHDALVRAEESIIEKIGPGAKASELFDLGQNIVRQVDPNYTRGHLGHGIGIELHEKPYLRHNPKEILLQPGMVITVELPYYQWGKVGYNLEDIVIVTEDGCKYASGRLSKELYVK